MIQHMDLLGIYLEKTVIWKDPWHPSIHCSTVCKSQDMEATQMSTDRVLDKEDGVHIYHKKNEIMPFAATRVDLETITLSEKSEKDK